MSKYTETMNRLNSMRTNLLNKRIDTTKDTATRSFNKVDFARNRAMRKTQLPVAKNINTPLTPYTCSGTAWKCEVAGSGKTPIQNVSMFPHGYDNLATPVRDAELIGRSFELPVVHNWKNSTIETKFTNSKLSEGIIKYPIL